MVDRLKVLALGWYGASNIGDELLLGVMHKWVKELGADLVIVSLNPEYTKRTYGTDSVDFHNIGEIARVMADCDLMLLGGGGIFQDHHPFNIHALYDPLALDISQYARPFYLAKQFGIPTLILGHGVGPLRSRSAKLVVKDIFSLADFVSLRDEHSLNLLKSIGVDRDIPVAADPGWFATRDFARLSEESFYDKEANSTKRLALIIRPWSKVPGWEDKLISALNRQLPQDWKCVWFAFQHAIDESRAESDALFLKQLAAELDDRIESEIVDCVSVDETVNTISRCDAVLSMRLHGSIIALALGLRSAFLEYDEKMAQAHQMAEVPQNLRLNVNSAEHAYDSLIAQLVADESPWRMNPFVLDKLQGSALHHRDILASAIQRSEVSVRGPKVWSGRDFDWVGAWIEDLIWQQRSAQSASDRAHSLLDYRDLQLRDVGQRFAALQQDMARLQQALDDQTGRSTNLSNTVETLTATNEVLQRKVIESEGEIAKAASDVRLLKAEGENYVMQLRDKEKEILKMVGDIEMLTADSKAKDSIVSNVEERLSSLVLQAHDLESGLAAQKAYIDEKEVHVAQLAQEIEALRKEVEHKSAYIAEKEIHVAVLMQELKNKNRNWGVVMQNRLQTLAPKLRRAFYIFQNGGPQALISAWKRRQYIRAAVDHTNNVAAPPPIPTSAGVSAARDLFYEAAKLQAGQLVVFSALPFSALEGFHRAAQLTKAALGTGRRAIYVTNASIEEGSNGIAGLRQLQLAELDVQKLFSSLSESAVIVNFLLDAAVRPYFQYAKNRGLTTYLDLQELDLGLHVSDVSLLPYFAEAASAVCVSGKKSRDRLAGIRTAHVVDLPAAACHVYFDVYRQFPVPAEFRGDSRQKFLVVSPGASVAIDWDYLIRTADLNSDRSFYLLGLSLPGCEVPKNIIFLSSSLAQFNAFVAHCDAVLVPICKDSFDTDAGSLGVLAGAFFNKYVISSQPIEISYIHNFLYAPDASRLDDLSGRIGGIVNNDLFVSRNSWLSRIESLVPGTPRNDVSVVILIHNNAKIIGRCLDTLHLHCAKFVSEVIVVDNASSDGGAELVEKEFPQVKLIRNPENGCSSGRNLGVKHASGKYIAFFDSDQWFTGGSGFAEALSILESHADVGVVGWNAGWFDATRTDLGGMIADYCPNRAMNPSAIRRGYRSDIGFLGTSGFFMRRATFDAIDGFDTFYDPTCFEDTDLCFQIRVLGMEVSYRDLSGIRHQPHQTTGANSGSDKYKALFLRNAEYFKKKWKDYPQFLVDYDFNAL